MSNEQADLTHLWAHVFEGSFSEIAALINIFKRKFILTFVLKFSLDDDDDDYDDDDGLVFNVPFNIISHIEIMEG